MKGHCLLICLLFLVAGATAALVGGWTPIKNVKEKHVVEIAEYAVDEYDKRSKKDLKLDSVVSGETQVVAGINYRLILKVKEKGSSKQYEAVVWEKAWENFKNLTSFKPVKNKV